MHRKITFPWELGAVPTSTIFRENPLLKTGQKSGLPNQRLFALRQTKLLLMGQSLTLPCGTEQPSKPGSSQGEVWQNLLHNRHNTPRTQPNPARSYMHEDAPGPDSPLPHAGGSLAPRGQSHSHHSCPVTLAPVCPRAGARPAQQRGSGTAAAPEPSSRCPRCRWAQLSLRPRAALQGNINLF